MKQNKREKALQDYHRNGATMVCQRLLSEFCKGPGSRSKPLHEYTELV